jgi:hypothetical protein
MKHQQKVISYFTEREFQSMEQAREELGQSRAGFIRFLVKQELKKSKYKEAQK